MRPDPIFKRRPLPLAIQLAAGLYMECMARPGMWMLQKLRCAEQVLGFFEQRQQRRFKRNNPFRDFRPAAQDVFVMTYSKSGTNWMMQIALQLIHHG